MEPTMKRGNDNRILFDAADSGVGGIGFIVHLRAKSWVIVGEITTLRDNTLVLRIDKKIITIYEPTLATKDEDYKLFY